MSALTILAIAGPALVGLPGTAAAQSAGTSAYAGYNPGRCVVHTRVLDGINRFDHRDTTMYTPARDTLFAATIRSILECERAYGGSITDPAEVLNVARVQLLTGQDEAAMVTIRRHIAAMADRPVEERAWELHLIIQDYLAANPARMERAKATLAKLDSLGKPAASLRTLSHYYMMNAAIANLDYELMQSEAAAVAETWSELDEETSAWRFVYLQVSQLKRAAVEALVNGRDAALMVLDSARGLIPGTYARSQTRLRNIERMYRLMGQQAAPIEAEFWYNTGATGTARPAPGRVSLILPIDRPCTRDRHCLAILDAVRHLKRKFRDQDLDVTFWIKTHGFYADTAPASPLAEARWDSAYYVHDLNLPGALAIAETPFSFMADGRRMDEPTANEVNYRSANVVVVDRHGIIRHVAFWWYWKPMFEQPLTALIGRLLREPPPGKT